MQRQGGVDVEYLPIAMPVQWLSNCDADNYCHMGLCLLSGLVAVTQNSIPNGWKGKLPERERLAGTAKLYYQECA